MTDNAETPDDSGAESYDASDAEFDRELAYARELLDDDAVTAAVVGIIREGNEVDTTFTQRADSPREEGLQALSLLAAHVRLVANEAGVDHTTVASDAASLAGAVEEVDPNALATAADDTGDPSPDDGVDATEPDADDGDSSGG